MSSGGPESTTINRVMAESLRNLARRFTLSNGNREVFLVETANALNARGAVYWRLDDPELQRHKERPPAGLTNQAKAKPEIAVGLRELGLMEDQDLAGTCGRMALQSMASGLATLLHPEKHPTLPPQFALLVIPLQLGRLPIGCIQLFLDSVEADQRASQYLEVAESLIKLPEQDPAPVIEPVVPQPVPAAPGIVQSTRTVQPDSAPQPAENQTPTNPPVAVSQPVAPQPVAQPVVAPVAAVRMIDRRSNGSNGHPPTAAPTITPLPLSPAAPLPNSPATGGRVTVSEQPPVSRPGSAPQVVPQQPVVGRVLHPQVQPQAAPQPVQAVPVAIPPTASVGGTGTQALAGVDPLELEKFLLELHRTLRIDHVTLTVVNDVRRLLGCDRVVLAVRRGARLHIEAVSGVERINRRSDELRGLLKLAKEVTKAGRPLSLSSDEEEIPPQLETPLADYVQQSGARMMRLVPLFQPDTHPHRDPENFKKNPQSKLIGCLILESFSDSLLPSGMADTADEVARHIATALNNALAVQKVPLIGLWRTMGSVREWLYGRHLTKILLVLAAIAAVIGILGFVPFEYRITADGKLMPVNKQRVFAPWDGDVVELLVQSGERVTAGTPVIRLENEELHQQLTASTNELLEKKQQELALRSEIDVAHREGESDEELRLRGQYHETRAQIIGLEEQVEILRLRYKRLLVTAPVDGVVATFQLEEQLRHRPVGRGEMLLEIMEENGPWELDVDVPDHRLGHLRKRLSASAGAHTHVEFILQTSTEKTYHGQLKTSNLGTRTTVNRDGEAVVEARIPVDADVIPVRNIGAEVTAKIDCGQMNLGYVLFGDVLEFIRRQLWL